MLINPFLKLVLTQPHLLAEHAQAYAELVAAELKKVSASMALRIGLFAGAGVLAFLGVVWGGIALMLWGSAPSDDGPAGWLLLVVPLLPIVIAVVLVFVARSKSVESGFDVIKDQVRADIDMVREVSST
jgi:hypothetical protein